MNNNELYSTKKLAELLDIDVDWLNHNRKTVDAIPYQKIGRYIRYKKSEVLEWIGGKNTELKFFSRKTLADKFDLDIYWFKNNKKSSSPIPFKHFGSLIRYQREEVIQWIKQNNHSEIKNIDL